MGGHEEKDFYIEFVVRAKRNKSLPFLPKLNKIVKGVEQLSELIEIPEFDYEKVKVGIDIGGKRRTLDLSNQQGFRAYYDITNEVAKKRDGHPTFESIDKLAKALLNDHLKTLNKDQI